MHEGEVLADVELVRRLLAQQFPLWSREQVVLLPATGTDNLVFRVGAELSVRMPRVGWAVEQVALDQEWLPRIAPHLPCPIATPLAVGRPGLGYPYPWAVHRWLPGTNAEPGDHVALAADLAGFVTALASLTDGPPSSRSGPLSTRDEPVREALATVADEVDLVRVVAVWEDALQAPEHDGPPVWRHADLTPGNVLVSSGRLAAVIDFGPSGLGDPAVDLVPWWRLFRGAARREFRSGVSADDAAWRRARGWALSIAALELAYYRDREPALAAAARAAIGEVLLP